ncbi:M10 family metallopeptidase C-terminal domain-containing protein [Halomonas sp. A40-4]|nr:M10 family metallopeptidase C-terminal domain-containing protein [Halomonas sp. A40-4]
MLYGDDGDDRILGEDGNDFINAGAGDDTVFGGNGDDLFVAEAGDGDDTYYGDDMVGGSGNDTLDMSAIMASITADLGTGFMGRGSVSSAETGNDGLWSVENIVTGSGDDTITANSANNVMDGGAGNDTFRFLSAADANGDTIMGFQPGDRIDLSGIDAHGCDSGNQSFTLVNDEFTGAGQLMFSHQTLDGEDYTVVQGNTTGGDDADFALSIKGRHDLTVSDFNL